MLWFSVFFLYLSIGTLSQHLKKLKLGGVGLLEAFFHMVAYINLFQDTVVLQRQQMVQI